MSYTGTEIFNMGISIIDELSDTGTIVDAQIAEYKYRAPYLLDMWQKEYAKQGSLYNTIEIVKKPLTNLLGNQFDIVEHIDEDLIYESTEVAHSFSFKVDNECSVYVEEYVSGAWVNAAGFYSKDEGTETAFTGVIAITTTTNPVEIKGRITLTGTKTRLRFTGSYYYQFYDFALFEGTFPSCSRVPQYGKYIKYDMPSNFSSVTQISEENPRSGLYHKWENNDELYIDYNYEGVLKITYKPTPAKITVLTQTLEIPETSAIAGAYYLAEHFALSDQNSELAQKCANKYAELKSEDKKQRPLESQAIIDVY